ncbi:MAG: ABC transporter substrate-binding protein [Thermodesulfobacteriota bacterium]
MAASDRRGLVLVLFLFLLAPLLLLVSGCGKPAEPLPLIRLGHAPHDHHAALYIAASLPDHFRANGGVWLKEVTPKAEYLLLEGEKPLARLQVSSEKGGIKLIRKLDEDLLDLSYGGVPAMLSLIDQGSGLRILLPTMGEGAGLVVHPAMTADDWPSFVAYVQSRTAPVKIGYKIGTSVQNIIFEAALREAEVPYSRDREEPGARVVLVNLHGTENLIPALEAGVIEGFVVNQPLVAIAVSRGAGKLLANLRDLPPAGRWAGIPCCAIAGNEAFVAKHPHEVGKLLDLLMRANDHITAHPQQSAEVIAAWLGVKPAVERLSIPTIRYSNAFSAEWRQGMGYWVETMIAEKELSGMVKTAWEEGCLDDLIYSNATRELRQRK